MTGIDQRLQDLSVPWHILRARAQQTPDREFIQLGSPWLSYGAFDDLTDGLAGAMQRLNVSVGDRVALLADASIEYALLLFACAKAGLVQVPINTYMRGEFLRYQLEDSGATVVIADEIGLREIATIAERLTTLKTVVCLSKVSDSWDVPFEVVDYAELLQQRCLPRFHETKPSDLCSILYTSGTTGRSKGCMISHAYFANMGRPFLGAGWFVRQDRMLSAFPLFHGGGQSVVIVALLAGGSISIVPGFSASTFMARALEIDATVLYGVGAIGMALLAQPVRDGERDHHIRLALWVPMTAGAQREFRDRFGIPVVSEIYAQTECLPVSIGTLNDRQTAGTSGRPLPAMDVVLVDDDDEPVPTGSVGEITIRPRAPHLMYSGYWNNAEATVTAWRNLRHHTGDLGRLDDQGNLHYVDRKKDAIRRRGENVSSIEVENAIREHPCIEHVAVHEVPATLGEDEIKACVVLRAGAALSPTELFGFLKQQLPYFAVPRYVEVVDALPVNAVGRVLKHELRAVGINAATWDFEEMGLVIAKAERR
jgi:crotonobetaine/carnitine-CoA ligase